MGKRYDIIAIFEILDLKTSGPGGIPISP